MSNKEIFQRMAKNYDNDDRIITANKVTKELEPYLKKSQDKIFLDYGGGTGLVSLPLAPLVKKLIISDVSENMLEVVEAKIKSEGLTNVSTKHLDYLTVTDEEKVDVILVSLVLLHIKETEAILKELYAHLNPGGTLLIVDFVKNDKVSHEKVHNGFELSELETLLKKIGFTATSSHPFYTADHLFMNQKATMFLAVASK